MHDFSSTLGWYGRVGVPLGLAALLVGCGGEIVAPGPDGGAGAGGSGAAAQCNGKNAQLVEGTLDGAPVSFCLDLTGGSFGPRCFATSATGPGGTGEILLAGDDGAMNHDGTAHASRGWVRVSDGTWLCGEPTNVTFSGFGETPAASFTWNQVRRVAGCPGTPVDASIVLSSGGLVGTLNGVPMDETTAGSFGGGDENHVVFDGCGMAGAYVGAPGSFLILPVGGELYCVESVAGDPLEHAELQGVTRLGDCQAATPVSGSITVSAVGGI